MKGIIDHLRSKILYAENNPHNLKPDATIKTVVIRTIAKNEFQEVQHLNKNDLLGVCEELLNSGDWREITTAFQWAYRIRKYYSSEDFQRFTGWIKRYITDWGPCDDFCTHAFGYYLYKFPDHLYSIPLWTRSENRWFRRGAAVVLIYSIRRGENYHIAFKVADMLLEDHDYLVQKGYGWMLKEISKKDQKLVFNYVMERVKIMPRTALRIAVEKFDQELRLKAMRK
jgi:3-methyladenine DNA glycosylase AlkD